jgi:hypothetical protein
MTLHHYDNMGFDKDGVHKVTGTKYNLAGFDKEGFNKKGWNIFDICKHTGKVGQKRF